MCGNKQFDLFCNLAYLTYFCNERVTRALSVKWIGPVITCTFRRIPEITNCYIVRMYSRKGNMNSFFNWSFNFVFFPGNTGVCRQITLVPSIRDVEWNSVTCPVSPTSLGILSEGIDGADVYSCCASNSRQLMCAGDNKGRLKLYRYPSQPKV